MTTTQASGGKGGGAATTSYRPPVLTESIPEEQLSPPIVPPHRPLAGLGEHHSPSAVGSSAEPPATDVEDEIWFWADASRDEVNEAMRNQANGAFLVRNSSSPGDYTLTLRLDGGNKLIRVFSRDGHYGFSLSEELRFRSLRELVEFYRHHSLCDYNRSLDTMLVYPLSRSQTLADDMDPRMVNVEHLTTKMCDFHRQYLRKSRVYDGLYDQYATASQEVQAKRQALGAFQETLKLFQNQYNVLGKFLKDPAENERVPIQENLALIQARCESLKLHIGQLEDDVKSRTAYHKRLEREINSTKPKLLWLYRRRERCQSLLLRRGMSQTALQKVLQDVTKSVEEHQKLDVRQQSPRLRSPAETNRTEQQLSLSDETAPCENSNKNQWLIQEGDCSKGFAVALLGGKADGTFLIRPSSKSGFYALSVAFGGAVYHCLIELVSVSTTTEPSRPCGYRFADTNLLFGSLGEFVQYYSKNSLRDHNPNLNTCLTYPALKA